MRVRLLAGLLLSFPLVACGNGSSSSPPCALGSEPCSGYCVPVGTCADFLCGDGLESCAGSCVPAGTCTEGTGSTSGSGGMPPVGGGGSGAVGPTGGVGATGNTGGLPPVTGGTPPTGGAPTGGAPPKECPARTGACSDTSTTTGSISEQFRRIRADVTVGDNELLKQYMLTANWWYTYNNQTVSMNGLSFSIQGSASNGGSDTPAGFPAMFIGNYQGFSTGCSNLPIQVSQITEIPTIFRTNVSGSSHDFNAAYDVWFTNDGRLLDSETDDNPGPGGAYLMVWLYDPDGRQPVGGPVANGKTVSGVSGNWTVWTGGNPVVISYLSDSPRSELTFDLNDFIQDAVNSGYGLTNNHYLNVVFAGFEVWNGGDGISVDQFCVDVR